MLLNKNWLYFLKAAELKTYSLAAHSLHVSQGAVSQSIQRLEEEIEAQLFERSRGRAELQLTSVGQLIYNKIKELETDFTNETLPRAKLLKEPLRICCRSDLAGRHFLPALRKAKIENHHSYLIPRQSHILTGIEKGHFDLALFSDIKSHRTTEVFCPEAYYLVGSKQHYPNLPKVKDPLEARAMTNLYERRPFEEKWSNLIEPDKSGYFLDDHHNGRELVLGGHVISPYSLFFFSKEERQQLTISKAPLDSPIQKNKWVIQAVYDKKKLSSGKIEQIEALLNFFRKSLLKESNEIRKWVSKL